MKKYLIALVVVILLIIIAGAVYLKLSNPLITIPNPVACTEEAKLCPDGVTYVGRQGPDCAFAECPVAQVEDEMSDWKTYRNDEYGFSIQYPSDWKVQEYKDSKNTIRTLAIDPVGVYTQSQYNSIDAPAGMLTVNFNYDNTSKIPEESFSSNNYQTVSQINIGGDNPISVTKIFTPDNGVAGSSNPWWRTKKSTVYFVGQYQIQNADPSDPYDSNYRIYPLTISYVTFISDTKYDQSVNEILGTLKITK